MSIQYIYIVLTFCLYFSTAQEIYTFKGTNETWSNSDNWSPSGPPTAGSIVIVTDADVTFDFPELTLAALYFNSTTTSTSYNYLTISGKLTITKNFVLFGYFSNVRLDQGGELHFDTDCKADIYCAYSSTSGLDSIVSNNNGLLSNKGTVNIYPYDNTVTGTQTFRIGYNNYPVPTIQNWGNWVVDPKVILEIYYAEYHHYNGTYNTTIGTSAANLRFYYSNIYIQNAGTDNFNSPIYFQSSSLGGTILFNNTGITLSYGYFEGMSLIFNHPATIKDSVFTSSTLLNTSSNALTVTITGTQNNLDSVKIAGDTTVFLDKNFKAYYSNSGDIYLYERAVFINDGQILNTTHSVYIDTNAWFVNSGLIELNSGYYFYFQSVGTNQIGTVVNRGTLLFGTSSYFEWANGYGGNFLQCDSANIKLGYGIDSTTSTPSTVWMDFKELSVDGYVSVWVSKNYAYKFETYQEVLTYDYTKYTDTTFFTGNVQEITTYEDDLTINPLSLCVLPSSGLVYLIQFTKGCKDYDKNAVSVESYIPGPGNACKDVPSAIMDLTPSCQISSNCGSLSTRQPVTTPSSAGIYSASFILLATFLGYLFSEFY